MLERRPWLPFALMLALALVACLVAAYENDWWIFRQPPHSYRPSRELTHDEFWEAADREYHERIRRGR